MEKLARCTAIITVLGDGAALAAEYGRPLSALDPDEARRRWRIGLDRAISGVRWPSFVDKHFITGNVWWGEYARLSHAEWWESTGNGGGGRAVDPPPELAAKLQSAIDELRLALAAEWDAFVGEADDEEADVVARELGQTLASQWRRGRQAGIGAAADAVRGALRDALERLEHH